MTSADNLNEPVGLPATANGRSISKLMHLIWRSRRDLQENFDLDDPRGRERFIQWFRDAAPREFSMPAIIPGDGRTGAASSSLLLGMKVFADRASRFSQWLPLRLRRTVRRGWTNLGISLSRYGVSPKDEVAREPERGVNLVGYANGMLSLGEHLRMTASAFEQTQLPAALVDYRNGARDRQLSGAERVSLVSHNQFSINLFHINADQMLNAYCHFGHAFFQRRYNIGFWAWELEEFPQDWVPVIDLLDEIWAPSRFVQNAIQKVTTKPVTLMPECVELPVFETRARDYFGLEEDLCLFIFTFDFLSYIDRKNPTAAVRAFHIAFPRGNERAGLVIKVMNGDESDDRWKTMIAEIDEDKRIKVINEKMSRGDSLALMNCCDCFVSLHRSEGFGRGPAEAMLLGKPVIVTAYSGNIDYTLPDNSFLVDYDLVDVQGHQYVYGEGQVWADPNVHHAAEHMKTVYHDPAIAAQVARKGQAHIREKLSARHIGELMVERLRAAELV